MRRRTLLLALLVLGGCKHGHQPIEGVPSDLKIVVGQQGTFAGRSMGYSIDAFGVVVRWEGKYPEEVKEATARLDSEQVRRLWRQAEAIGLLRLKDQAMATVNHFVSVSANGESRRVTWVDDGPPAVVAFYKECLEAAKRAF